MTRLDLARDAEREAAAAVNAAWLAKDVEGYRTALEEHLRCIARRQLAERWQHRAA